MTRKTVEERFWSKVDEDGPVCLGRGKCWTWIAGKNPKGYGIFGVIGGFGEQLAHRISYRLLVDDIPNGLLVCHHCDNPPCVNPKHLFLGTHVDNANDMVKKGRQSCRGFTGHATNWNSACGEKHGMAKLTENDVLSIRSQFSKGGITQIELGRIFGVTKLQIHNIVHRKRWKHI